MIIAELLVDPSKRLDVHNLMATSVGWHDYIVPILRERRYSWWKNAAMRMSVKSSIRHAIDEAEAKAIIQAVRRGLYRD